MATPASAVHGTRWQGDQEAEAQWYSVRCGFAHLPSGGTHYVYEERITAWRAESFEAAIALAEEEASEYTSHFSNQTDTGLAQCY